MIRFFTEKPAKNVMENDEDVTPVDDTGDNKIADGVCYDFGIFVYFCFVLEN